jgi:hypothetical protein
MLYSLPEISSGVEGVQGEDRVETRDKSPDLDLRGFAGGAARGIGSEDRADSLALVGRELALEFRRVQFLISLVGGHLAEIGDGVNHGTAAGAGDCVQLLYGAIPLLLLLRAETLKALDAVELLVALLGVHRVETVQLIEFTLLQLGREFAEARFVLQSTVLIGGG